MHVGVIGEGPCLLFALLTSYLPLCPGKLAAIVWLVVAHVRTHASFQRTFMKHMGLENRM